MDEKIVKLIKLANHNSNENEANSAARRACKMIEAAGFDSSRLRNVQQAARDYAQQQQKESQYETVYDYDYTDYMSSFAERMRRNQEAAERRAQERKKEAEDARKKAEQARQERQRYDYTQYRPMWTPDSNTGKEKRTLTCSECKMKVETMFRGLPEAFMCNPCSWTAYTRGNKSGFRF